MLLSIAAMRPPTIATSRIALILAAGSMTRPPLMTKSEVAASALEMRVSMAAPAAAAKINSRRVVMVDLSVRERPDHAAYCEPSQQRRTCVEDRDSVLSKPFPNSVVVGIEVECPLQSHSGLAKVIAYPEADN